MPNICVIGVSEEQRKRTGETYLKRSQLQIFKFGEMHTFTDQETPASPK